MGFGGFQTLRNDGEFQTADRGAIYEFIERDGTQKNLVLIVSSQMRCEDNMCSTIMLGTKNTGYDCVPIEVNGKTYFAHCGLVTYAKRNRLGNKICEVDKERMERVDVNIASQLGLNYLTEYKQKYETLLALNF